MQLQHSNVKRGGVTAQYWYGETNVVSGNVNESGLHLRFTLPSKGGGDTDILLTVGPEDLQLILRDLALSLPSLAATLAGATHTAILLLMKPPQKNPSGEP